MVEQVVMVEVLVVVLLEDMEVTVWSDALVVADAVAAALRMWDEIVQQ